MSETRALLDAELILAIEQDIYVRSGGKERFRRDVPPLLRKAIDEVIDTARSARFTLDEVDKVEKTYLGLKVEILLRDYLKAPRVGKLDMELAGVAVDVKNTVHGNWTIPSEAIGHPCLLVREDEAKALCWLGLVIVKDEILTTSPNRDGKRTIAAANFSRIHWLLHSAPYPKNFWLTLDADLRNRIVAPAGGTSRLAALFREVQNTCISRITVEGLAQQKDYMKRLRKNGGARDVLAKEDIALLWGKKQQNLISELNLPSCIEGFISVPGLTVERRLKLGLPLKND